MLVLNRKRLSLIILVVMLGVFTFSYNESKQMLGDLQTVTATPVSGKVVILDAGHGTPDEGAESNNGTTEAEINLKIALKVQNLLEQTGCTVLLTRSDENGIYDSKVSDIKNRVKIGNESSADIFVSIHLNKIPQGQYYGWQCFFNTKNENSKVLANQIQENLNEAIQKENKRVAMNLDTIYIMKNVEIPISVVECGFLSNVNECEKLKTREYQEKVGVAIWEGINEILCLEKAENIKIVDSANKRQKK